MGPKDISTTEILEPPNNWWTLAANWVFHQGVSTVLLFLILYAVAEYLPPVVEKVQQDNRDARSEFLAANEVIRKEYREDLKSIVNSNQQLQQEILNVLRNIEAQKANIRRSHNADSPN